MNKLDRILIGLNIFLAIHAGLLMITILSMVIAR